MKRIFKKTYIVLGMILSAFIWLQMGTDSFAFTRTTGSVTGSSVKVRESASTNADVVASVKAGDVVDVTDEVSAADGSVWYKIVVKANEYGYIRSDFVTLSNSSQSTNQTTTNQTTTQNTTTQNTTTQVEPSVVTPMEAQNGHTNTSNVKVRQQASTSSSELDRINEDVVFSITGSATGSDNKVWYQVTYIDNGKSITGFIRSDLVEIMAEEIQEEETEQIEEIVDEDVTEDIDSNVPAPSVEYEAVYTTDETGAYIWYLYDRTAGQRYKIEQLLQVGTDTQTELEELSSANFGLKIGLIVTICILLMGIVAVVFYFLKMRDDDDEPEPVVYRKRSMPSASQTDVRRNTTTQRTVSSGTQKTGTTATQRVSSQGSQGVRTQSTQGARTQGTQEARTQNAQSVRPKTSNVTRSQNPQGAASGTPVARPSVNPEKQKTSWKAKNFLEDNDEFEFGFLDFDEDDE